MKPRKVILATARAITAARLSRRISDLPGYEIAGQAADLSGTYVLTENCEPHLALIGSELTRQGEFEGLLSLLRVIGISWIEIPDEAAPKSMPADESAEALRRWLEAARPPPEGPGKPLGLIRSQPARSETRAFQPDKIILIGASTGGIDALLTILSTFPADCPPTAIVQHTGSAFSDSLIRLFARCSPARVLPAATGISMTPGTIIVGAGAPGHLRLESGPVLRSSVKAGPLISGHLPSIDALFSSAVPFATSVAAALLTGMGRDGANGLLALRRAGAMTFAQDQASSTVYGMPRAAAEIGAACDILPLNRMAAALLTACQKKTPAAQRQTAGNTFEA